MGRRTVALVVFLCSLPVGGAWADTVETVTGAEAAPYRPMQAGVYVGGFISNFYHQFASDENLATREELDTVSPQFGARYAYFFHPMVGAEVEGAVTLASTKEMDNGATILGFRAQVVAQYPWVVIPFAVAGYGVAHVRSDALGNDTDSLLHIGGGVRYPVNEDISVRAEARFLRGPSNKDPYTLDASYGEFMVGVSYALGGGSSTTVTTPPPDVVVDSDGDGITDDKDACPSEAGTEPDGCKPADSDGDEIADNVDKCPNEAENRNGFEDDDGCPDEKPDPDADGDGIAIPKDTCPDEPEDKDNFEDDDGCPDPDNDSDGVADAADRCPEAKGPAVNRGCPDMDMDADEVVDRLDNCPATEGTVKNHGCKTRQRIAIHDTELKLLDPIRFARNRATIQRRSRLVLRNVASVLKVHPEIAGIRIEVHTDDNGKPEVLKRLSEQRAKAVRAFLIGKGVEPERLEAVGLGGELPVDDSDTRAARAKNERVELTIVGR